MKKSLLLATASILAFGAAAAPAFAADLAARPYTKAPPMVAAVYDWSGFYIGINGGGGSAHKCWDLAQLGLVPVVPNLAEGCHDATGGTIGGQIGYRWQMTNWVFGVEGQGNWANFSGSNLNLQNGVPPFFFVAGLTDRSKIDSFGMLTGSVGYAWNNVLGYVKGGAAVVHDKYDTFIAPIGTPVDSATENRWGGVVGVGLEIGFAHNWSVGVEYDHMFLGSRNVTAVTPLGAISAVDRIRQDVDLGLVRLNYKFGGPVVAKY